MKLEYPKFEYFDPTSLPEAIDILTQHGDAAKVIAGGTALLMTIRERKAQPAFLVDISRIPGLSGIETANGGGVVIGAATTLQQVLSAPAISNHNAYSAIAEAISRLGSRQIRNAGTIGGNVCHASPGGDTLAPLLVLDAWVKAVGLHGERVIPLRDFFRAPGATVLKHDEIVTTIVLPVADDRTVAAYVRFSPRRVLDMAVASAAVMLRVDANGICADCKIALGAVAPTPVRTRTAEQMLIGQPIGEDVLAAAGASAAQEAAPITDVRGSAEHRRAILPALVKRAAQQALAKIQGGQS